MSGRAHAPCARSYPATRRERESVNEIGGPVWVAVTRIVVCRQIEGVFFSFRGKVSLPAMQSPKNLRHIFARSPRKRLFD